MYLGLGYGRTNIAEGNRRKSFPFFGNTNLLTMLAAANTQSNFSTFTFHPMETITGPSNHLFVPVKCQ